MIAAASAIIVGATTAFLSDTETSSGNTFSVGTVDIDVGGQNPWTDSWTNTLDKPDQVNYMNFTINNVGDNPANVWKRINNIAYDGGSSDYSCDPGAINSELSSCPVVGVSSEPECQDGTNNYTQCYEERDNIASYLVYDMSICHGTLDVTPCETDPETGAPTGNGWTALIPEANEVRLDSVNGMWIKLDDALNNGESLAVSQSYHLTAWTDAQEDEVTNWAQGDEMTFDIELEARQLTAPAPGSENATAMANLVQKDTTTWDPVSGGASGTLIYNVQGETFDYDFTASGLVNGDYQLIYYPDPWANPKTIVKIGNTLTASSGSISALNQSFELSMDLPNSASGFDANYPVGAKIWLVPTASLTSDQLSWSNLDQFLFETNLVQYDDIGI